MKFKILPFIAFSSTATGGSAGNKMSKDSAPIHKCHIVGLDAEGEWCNVSAWDERLAARFYVEDVSSRHSFPLLTNSHEHVDVLVQTDSGEIALYVVTMDGEGHYVSHLAPKPYRPLAA